MESNGNNLSNRERNLSGLPTDREGIFIYLNSLDKTDLLLMRDTVYLFCGGDQSKAEKAISKILKAKAKI